MIVVPLPSSLDYRTTDSVLAQLPDSGDGRVLLDGRHLRWVDPYGMLTLLAIGRVLSERTGEAPTLDLPMDSDVSGYIARMGFFRAAEGLFQYAGSPPHRQGRPSDVLLEVTQITTNSDVHSVVDRVQERAGVLLSQSLGYPPTSVMQFSVILSEVCQNILEHAEGHGWVAAQVYHWSRRLGRHVLLLAVADVGRGFKGSLEDEHSARFGDRWSDSTALEAAFIHGITRFPDSGRGQGIQQIRKQVRKWSGAISVRSGGARIADVPEWEEMEPLVNDLPWFPGAQINIILPEKIAADDSGGGR